MKGNLKKVTATALLSVAVAFSALGITGCAQSESDTNEETAGEIIGGYCDMYVNNVFVVYNGKLHKGDITFVGSYKYGHSIPVIETDCGMNRITNNYSISPDMPYEDEYERVCEECLSQE